VGRGRAGDDVQLGFPGAEDVVIVSPGEVRISVVENPRRPGFVNADIGSTAASVSSEKDI
jgi:hypothetical protein